MRWSLRRRFLAIFVAAVLLVTAVTTVVGVRTASEGIRDSITREQEESGLGIARSLDLLIESANRSLASTASLLAESDLRPRVDEGAVAPLLDVLVAQSPEVDALLLLTSTGAVALVRPGGHPAADASFGDGEAFLGAAASHVPTLALAGAAGSPTWVHPVPSTLSSGSPVFLAGVMSVNRIRDVLLQHGLAGTEAFLVASSGAPVAATDPEMTLPANLPAGAADGEASFAGREEDGRLVAWLPLASAGAGVALSTSAAELEASQLRLALQSVVLAMVLAAAAIFLGVWTARHVTRPLAELEGAARRMGGGDLAARATPAGPPEVRSLAREFNQMASSLQREHRDLLSLQGHLETLVEQRTLQLEDKRKEMELFFYGVAHDIKSPIVSISALTQMTEEELAGNGRDRREIRALVSRIRDSSEGLKTLVQELLQFARAERLPPAIAEVVVDEVVQGVLREQEAPAREKEVALRARGPPSRIFTDPERLHHILVNLVGNAVKYMPEGRHRPAVDVAWSASGGWLEMVVEDNGGGIPAAVRESLFQPFTHHARPGGWGQGAGLGLSVVKRFVDSLGGSIVLETPAGGGTRFRVRLPTGPPPAAGGWTPAKAADSGNGETGSGARR